MPLRRLTQLLIAAATGVLIAVSVAAPASAVTIEQKLSVLYSWTQANSTSYNSWNSARLNQAAWADYAFDWSTDYCSDSPDQPLGFDFRLPCWRHDFGYRNYKAVGQFSANKSRIDDAFYYDLKAKCATYSIWVRASCYSLAWSYYQAVKTFGSLTVTQDDLNRAGQLKAQGMAAEKAAAASLN